MVSEFIKKPEDFMSAVTGKTATEPEGSIHSNVSLRSAMWTAPARWGLGGPVKAGVEFICAAISP